MAQRDYYEVLGIPRDADADAIKKAYRKLALQFHPDRNKADDASEKFKEATEAYAILSDSKKRAAYDRFGHAGVQGTGAAAGGIHFEDLQDIFSQFADIFGSRGGGGGGGGFFENLFGFGGGGGRSRVQRGRSLRAAVEIDLEDVLHGTERLLSIRRNAHCDKCGGTGAAPGSKLETCRVCRGQGVVHQQQGFFAVRTTCPACRGQGRTNSAPCGACRGSGLAPRKFEVRVQIPPGIEEDAQIRMPGQGEPGPQGGPPGDLFVEVHIRPQEHFHREGRDLYREVPVSYSQAVLGDKIRVRSLDGEVRMTIPAGTPTGKLFRVRGQGLPKLHGGARGDLFVRVYLEVPTRISKEEKALIRKLAQLDKDRQAARRKA